MVRGEPTASFTPHAAARDAAASKHVFGGILYAGYARALIAAAALRLREARLSDGVTRYADTGKRGRPALLLLHGLTGDLTVWLPAARHLSSRFRLIVPDLPGHGESDFDPEADYGIAAQSKRVLELLEHLDLEQVCTVGNSMGAWLGCELALRWPTRVSALMLISPAGLRGRCSSWLDQRVAAGKIPFLADNEAAYGEFLGAIMAQPPRVPSCVKRHLLARHVARLERISRLYADYAASPSPAPGLKAISAPVHLLWGSEDRIVAPSACEAWEAALSGTTVEVEKWRSVGHMAMLERPAQTAGLISKFLGGASAQGARHG
ncbi:alpha/beta fold hydrolase [Luteimonas sp. TWI1416]|uniref:alpha/beta fold hydrolase n=1 Tax=unclassified Luteimonas TaxID=2629088 RepID=UPI003207EC12